MSSHLESRSQRASTFPNEDRFHTQSQWWNRSPKIFAKAEKGENPRHGRQNLQSPLQSGRWSAKGLQVDVWKIGFIDWSIARLCLLFWLSLPWDYSPILCDAYCLIVYHIADSWNSTASWTNVYVRIHRRVKRSCTSARTPSFHCRRRPDWWNGSPTWCLWGKLSSDCTEKRRPDLLHKKQTRSLALGIEQRLEGKETSGAFSWLHLSLLLLVSVVTVS